MTVFAYKGRSPRGEVVEGRLDADTADQIATRLLTAGITPIDIGLASEQGGATLRQLWITLGRGKPNNSDLMMFSRQMYTITKAGVPLLRGLRGLQASMHNDVLRDALADIVSSLESGRDLGTSFARHSDIFPPLYVNMVRVGEATGTLDTAFLRLCDYLGMEQDVHDRVKSALRYPLIVVAAVILAIGIISVKVIPAFAPIFRVLGNNIPLPTRLIMGASSITQHYWWLILLLAAAAFLAARAYVGTDAGRYQWHRALLKMPIVGSLLHEAILARVTRSFAICLSAGIPALQALGTIARTTGNDCVSEAILHLRDMVERGESISRAAATAELFPALVVQMIAVGEETGELSELLGEVAEHYRRDVDYQLKNLSAIIEPALIVVVGAVVLVLALGVFLPMWDMFAKVGGQS
ncbi:MAG TPA: type II secretion system F family protein [Steroidobacteraceae bacterium]|nr:type II secretion system F family protein [Steroidobacteraceae bacterium]